MKDLRMLLSGDATDFERQLLGAAAAERPSPELQLRMQQALGLGPVAAPGPDTSSAGPEISGTHVAVKAVASRWAAGTWLKVVLGVGAGAGLVAAGLALPSGGPAPLDPAFTPAPEQAVPTAPVEAPAAAKPSTAKPSTAGPSADAPSTATPSTATPSATSSRQLREEIDLLDRVRSALDQRDARAASALLDSYAQRFPEGRLAPEAAVLRARATRVARSAR